MTSFWIFRHHASRHIRERKDHLRKQRHRVWVELKHVHCNLIYGRFLEYRRIPCWCDRKSSSRVAYVSRTEVMTIPSVRCTCVSKSTSSRRLCWLRIIKITLLQNIEWRACCTLIWAWREEWEKGWHISRKYERWFLCAYLINDVLRDN
jgi:hypothetical protein